VAIYDWDDDEDWPRGLPADADWRIGVALVIAVSTLIVLATYLL